MNLFGQIYLILIITAKVIFANPPTIQSGGDWIVKILNKIIANFISWAGTISLENTSTGI